jgi:hypothetical protein
MSLGKSYIATLNHITALFDPATTSDADLVDMTEALQRALAAVEAQQRHRVWWAEAERRYREREGGR